MIYVSDNHMNSSQYIYVRLFAGSIDVVAQNGRKKSDEVPSKEDRSLSLKFW